MASLCPGVRRDDGACVHVLYRVNREQSSTWFEDVASATNFHELVHKFGLAKALSWQ